jgi:hypothetical protein
MPGVLLSQESQHCKGIYDRRVPSSPRRGLEIGHFRRVAGDTTLASGFNPWNTHARAMQVP